MNYKNTFSIIAGVMLLIAIPPIWPYGYFEILRWVVTGVALYNAFVAHELGKTNWVWIMAVIAVLFNPILLIHLTKEVWSGFDLVTAIVMFVFQNKFKAPFKKIS